MREPIPRAQAERPEFGGASSNSRRRVETATDTPGASRRADSIVRRASLATIIPASAAIACSAPGGSLRARSRGVIAFSPPPNAGVIEPARVGVRGTSMPHQDDSVRWGARARMVAAAFKTSLRNAT